MSTAGLKLGRTLKCTARGGAVGVDRAPVIVAEELAFSIDVRQHVLADERGSLGYHHVLRERREPANFIAGKQGGILMAVLTTAGSEATRAW